MNDIKLILIFAILSSSFFISNVNAVSLSMGPTYLTIENAARGGEYEKYLFVNNAEILDVDLSLNTSGECGNWIHFYLPEDRAQPITSFILPKESSKTIFVEFTVPEEIPSGNYSCIVHLQQNPSSSGSGSATVGIRLRSNVNIEVTGEQIISGNVIGITTKDIEINNFLRIKTEFQNTGNVIANPEIKITITKNGNYIIDDFTYSEKSFKVNQRDYIEMEWDSTGQTVGDYTANVKVYLGSNLIGEKDLDFKILERGTLTAEGMILNVNAPSEVDAEGIVKIEIQFRNTGEIDLRAKTIGEIYYNDQLIDTVSSDEVLVKIGETKTLTSYFKPENSGEYIIKANVVYEGKTLEMDPISITVKSSSPLTGFSVLPILTNPILWIVLGTIIVVAIAVLIKKRRYYSSFSHKKFRYFSLAYSWLKYTYKPFYNVLSRFAFLIF